jgi:hypothetical protein
MTEETRACADLDKGTVLLHKILTTSAAVPEFAARDIELGAEQVESALPPIEATNPTGTLQTVMSSVGATASLLALQERVYITNGNYPFSYQSTAAVILLQQAYKPVVDLCNKAGFKLLNTLD